MVHLVHLYVPIVKHATYSKNHYGLDFPGSPMSLEAVRELNTCFTFFAAWDAFAVGPLCPDNNFLFAAHDYVYEEQWGDRDASESDYADMQTNNGGSDQSDHGGYEGEDNGETSKINLDATTVGEYD